MTTSAQQGWYDDPEDPNGQRYWDGQTWTPHRQKKPVSQASPPRPPQPAPSAPAYPPPGQHPQWTPPGAPPQRSNKTLWIVVAVVAACVVLPIGGLIAWLLFNFKVIDEKVAAQTLTSAVSENSGFTPTGVSCPSGVEAKVDNTFDCHFTGPAGPYTAHMKVSKVDGDNVYFDMKWELNSGG
jgi:Domain of unknown function (DUF4333)/Protein of unknown function (DUF2510)